MVKMVRDSRDPMRLIALFSHRFQPFGHSRVPQQEKGPFKILPSIPLPSSLVTILKAE